MDHQRAGYKSEYLLDVVQPPVADQQVRRSASSVTGKNAVGGSGGGGVRAPIATPVRRSKSQAGASNLVTNIRHGGPVTFVSVNNVGKDLPGKAGAEGGDDLAPEGLHEGRTEVFQGSHTLPRAGAAAKKKKR